MMHPNFCRLNKNWSAEPNAPDPTIAIDGDDVVLSFFLNPFLYPDFHQKDRGLLRFIQCERYRLGSTNDEGWYTGQCRFSKTAPAWGEFYLVEGDATLLEAPKDWRLMASRSGAIRHFLFYFRDNTFECVATRCIFEPSEDNALLRLGKLLECPASPF
jgi:hypothetical protein